MHKGSSEEVDFFSSIEASRALNLASEEQEYLVEALPQLAHNLQDTAAPVHTDITMRGIGLAALSDAPRSKYQGQAMWMHATRTHDQLEEATVNMSNPNPHKALQFNYLADPINSWEGRHPYGHAVQYFENDAFVNQLADKLPIDAAIGHLFDDNPSAHDIVTTLEEALLHHARSYEKLDTYSRPSATASTKALTESLFTGTPQVLFEITRTQKTTAYHLSTAAFLLIGIDTPICKQYDYHLVANPRGQLKEIGASLTLTGGEDIPKPYLMEFMKRDDTRMPLKTLEHSIDVLKS